MMREIATTALRVVAWAMLLALVLGGLQDGNIGPLLGASAGVLVGALWSYLGGMAKAWREDRS